MVPDCLTKAYELIAALGEAEALKESLLSHPQGIKFSDEIDYLESQIADLNRQAAKNAKQTNKVLSLLRKRNSRAYTAAKMHFVMGYKWDVVSEILDIDYEVIRARVYRSLNELYSQGLIER